MEENHEMNQVTNDEQHLQELRQRINAKAENLSKVLSKRPFTSEGKRKDSAQ